MNGALARLPAGMVTAFAVLGAVLLVLFMLHVLEILAVLFLGVVVGISLAPVTDGLARWHVPRAISVLGVYLVIAGAIVGFLWYAIPELTEEINALVDRSDEFEQEYQEAARKYNLPPLDDLGEYLRSATGSFAPNLARQAFVLAASILYVVSIMVVALFFNTVKESAKALFLSLIGPAYRARTEEVLGTIGMRLRRYVYAELISMTIIGSLTYIGLRILGAPFPALLAGVAFVLELVPILGPWIAVIPAVALALTKGPELAIAVAVLYLVIQQIESNIVLPLVQRHQLGMPSIIILAAVLIGGSAMGVIGVLVSLPLAVMFYTLAVEVIIPWRQRQVGEASGEAAAIRAAGGVAALQDSATPNPVTPGPSPDATGEGRTGSLG